MSYGDESRLVLLCFHLMEPGSPAASAAAEELRRRRALWVAGTTFACWTEETAEELSDHLYQLRSEGVEVALADVEGGLDGLAGDLASAPESLEDTRDLLPDDVAALQEQAVWPELLEVYEAILTTGLPPED